MSHIQELIDERDEFYETIKKQQGEIWDLAIKVARMEQERLTNRDNIGIAYAKAKICSFGLQPKGYQDSYQKEREGEVI